MNYYNDNDPYCREWLENLIAEGLLPPGDVDDRSIRDVRPDDVAGYTQCHFFAGLGGWPYALDLAGWPRDREAWTGSCPCQPFSAAGKQQGFADDRHLWPEFARLIRERRPPIVFGEQVARAHQWLALVRSDLEKMDYAVAAMPIEAASVGAKHKRDRYWFVAYSGWERGSGWRKTRDLACAARACEIDSKKRQRNGNAADNSRTTMAHTVGYAGVARGAGVESEGAGGRDLGRGGISANDVANSDDTRLAQRQGERGDACAQQPAAIGASWWSVEPNVGRVAHGVPARVAKLRALGNAIVPQVAAEFVMAATDAIPDFLLRKNWINGMPPASSLVGTYSMLNAYNNCPHAMYRRYIKKDLGPYVETPEIKWGNEVHEAMELRLKANKPLPASMQQWEAFAVPFDGKKPSAEPKLAVDRDAKACDYGGGAFFRGKVDVIVESGTQAYIFDWKTGNSKYEDPFELATNAVLLQAARPHLKKIQGAYVWLKENRMSQPYDLSDTGATWVKICARMGDIEDDKAEGVFAKKKTGLCGYCSVKDCENWYDAKARRA